MPVKPEDFDHANPTETSPHMVGGPESRAPIAGSQDEEGPGGVKVRTQSKAEQPPFRDTASLAADTPRKFGLFWQSAVVCALVLAAVASIIYFHSRPTQVEMNFDVARTLVGHKQPVWTLAFSDDGRFLASGSDDYSARIWSIATGEQVQQLSAKAPVTSVAFGAPEPTLCAATSHDHSFALTTLHELGTMDGKKVLRSTPPWIRWVMTTTCSPFNQLAAMGSIDGSVILVNPRISRAKETVLGSHSRSSDSDASDNWISAMAFSSDAQRLASGSNRELHIWDTTSGRDLEVLHGTWLTMNALAFSPDGHWLAEGGNDLCVKIFDLRNNGREFLDLKGHSNVVLTVAFGPDGTWIASGSRDGTVKIWQLPQGRRLATLNNAEEIDAIAISPDGKMIASAGQSGAITLWARK